MNTIVRVRDMSFTYGGRVVFQGVNMEVRRGDYVGLVGPNGSGKTTLIRLILRLLRPDRGRIELFGVPARQFKAWRKVGYVGQNVSNFNHSFPATVREVVGAALPSGRDLFWFRRRGRKEEIDRVLDIVGMREQIDRRIGTLSGGQIQRVFIARALVSSPEILFLDEPAVGIDASARERFYELLETMNRRLEITIVIVSHDIGVIIEQVDTIYCVGNRKLIRIDEAHELQGTLEGLYGEKVNILLHHH